LAGLVLIGVAVVAVGLGVFTLTSNGASPQSQGRPPVTGTTTTKPPPPKTTPPPRRTTPGPPTTTTRQTPPATTPPVLGPTTTVAPPPPAATTGAPTLKQTVPVRVYNNSFVKDLAANAGRDIRAAGFDVVATGNYAGGNIPTTTVYYSAVAGEHEIANEIGKDFGMRVLPRFQGIAFASPGVIVIVTDDFKGGGK
jgi:hypothetical protein